ncbi:DP-EP family protein [Pseudoalteromonas sp. 2CM39R]|uniref:DP-EP family protein n=1 Tax=Pseudoalteromonas sp. 2CM39R TaxID=2929856 RepID=UPI0020C156B3|nr:DP-EP family protein [Pseudoalteromonas sp. 2CM39R]MCK8125973.1 DP-EP family protein [Pseudoalteromonas sp. 2CM39R]
MSNYKVSPQIDVVVIATFNPETESYTFSYYDDNGNQTDGDVTVTVQNTLVNYKLTDKNEELIFNDPELSPLNALGEEIIDGNLDDITVSISNDKKTVTVIDADLTNEQIAVHLVVSSEKGQFVSSDPRITNKGEN